MADGTVAVRDDSPGLESDMSEREGRLAAISDRDAGLMFQSTEYTQTSMCRPHLLPEALRGSVRRLDSLASWPTS
jgi:hypothetical protein